MKIRNIFIILICLFCQFTTLLASEEISAELKTHPTFKSTILTPDPQLTHELLRTRGMKAIPHAQVTFDDFEKLLSISPIFVNEDELTGQKGFIFRNNDNGKTLVVYRDPNQSQIIKTLSSSDTNDEAVNDIENSENTESHTPDTHIVTENEEFSFILEHQKVHKKIQLKAISKKNSEIVNSIEAPYVGESLWSFPFSEYVSADDILDARSGLMVTIVSLDHGTDDCPTGIDTHTGKLIQWFPSPKSEEDCKAVCHVFLDHSIFYLRRFYHGPHAGKTVPVAFDLKTGQEVSNAYNFGNLPPYPLIGFEFIFKENQIHTLLKVRDQFHVRYLNGPGVFPSTYTSEAADIFEILQFGDQEVILKFNHEQQLEYFVRADKNPNQEYKLISLSDVQQQLLTPPYPTVEQLPIFLNFYISNPKDGLNIPTGLAISQGVKPGQKVPALIYLHGGPASYHDNDLGERHYLLCTQPFALFVLNLRGSTEISSDHYTAAKGQMEDLLNEDIAAVARYAARLEFIDANNIFLWGDSWGGYLTASAMLSHGDLFKAGICCAGIYDWAEFLKSESNASCGINPKLKESFMKRIGLNVDPELNSEENKRISPVHRLSLLKKPLLFLHGTADENVEVRQTNLIQKAAMDLDISPNLIKVKLIEGADHEFSEHLKEYYSTILEFISQQMTGS